MKRYRSYIRLSTVVLSLLLVYPDALVRSADLTTRVELTGPNRESTTLYAMVTRGIRYVPLPDLVEWLDCRMYRNVAHQKIEIFPDQRRIKVTGNNPFIMIDGRIHQLRSEVLSIQNTLFVPLDEFLALLDRNLSGNYSYRRGGETVTPAPQMPAYQSTVISALTIEEKTNGILLWLEAKRPFEKPSHWYDSNNWLYIQIPGGVVKPESFVSPLPTALIRETRVDQLENVAQIAVRLSHPMPAPHITQDRKTHNIQISLPKESTEHLPTVNLADLLRSQQKVWDFNTIVLDAGHGGKDPGTHYGRIQEKRLNLDIVLRLGKLLEEKTAYNVVYTRKSDVFITVEKRPQIANEAKGKLFISIHTNSARNRSANGIEVYILGPGKRNDSAVRVAERENKVALEFEDNSAVYEKMTEAQLMKFSIMESGFMRESEHLAALLSNHMAHAANARTRGVKQAIFYVLWGASMPRVLVEVGYLSNTKDRKNLDNSRYRQQLAEGMFAGVEEFIKQHRRVIARQGE